MHIDQKLLFLGLLPAALEEHRDILIPTMTAQRQSDPAIDEFGIPG
jgi:hypothetical protein